MRKKYIVPSMFLIYARRNDSILIASPTTKAASGTTPENSVNGFNGSVIKSTTADGMNDAKGELNFEAEW